MDIREDEILRGSVNKCWYSVEKRVYNAIRGREGFYIGRTSNLQDRAERHEKEPPQFWGEMIGLYESHDIDSVRKIEKRLIQRFFNWKNCRNKEITSYGPVGSPPHYVYLLISQELHL